MIQSVIDGRLGIFEDRMAKLLYKLTVEMDMGVTAALEGICSAPAWQHLDLPDPRH